jgi:hypothetical protein
MSVPNSAVEDRPGDDRSSADGPRAGWEEGRRDDAWCVALGSSPDPRVDEALGTLANGVVGTRAVLEEVGPRVDDPIVLTPGCAVDAPTGTQLEGPIWTWARRGRPDRPTRWLDLAEGILHRRDADGRHAVRFVSLARPGVVALRMWGVDAKDLPPPLVAPPVDSGSGITVARDVTTPDAAAVERDAPGVGSDADDGPIDHHGQPGVVHVSVHADSHTIGGVGSQQVRGAGPDAVLERIAALAVDHHGGDPAGTARTRHDAAVAAGWDTLLAEHRRAWARRWDDADARIHGQPHLTRALRFALFHLLATVGDLDEVGVAARGLSGTAYAGHVFWDADVFVLPVLAAVRPASARAMLEYRRSRLPAARAAAAEEGRPGARFPWESACTGRDVTPTEFVDEDGDVVPILTGERALHIGADIAWAAWHYLRWTGDREWFDGGGRDLVVEPARYLASRIERDGQGVAHLRGVVGPDEYHAPVDDDLYTNVVVRWNLRLAARLAARAPALADGDEWRRWLRLADDLADGWDAEAGHHRAFAGVERLEPLLIGTIASLPVAADVLLGRERVANSQVLKQPNLVMAHHVLPDELRPGSLVADLDWEGPRLAHGSSLSPAILAAVQARAGRPDAATEAFDLAARMDLEDVTRTTAEGLHMATMGGLWQALATGFLGLRPTATGLQVDPRLPEAWDGVEVTVRHHGTRVHLAAGAAQLEVTTDGPVALRARGGPPRTVDGHATIDLPVPGASDRRNAP